MADGTTKEIRSISAGELIADGRGGVSKVRSVLESVELEPILAISVDGRTVQVSQKHPFPTRDGFKPASDLVEGDEVLNPDGSYDQIQKIESLPIDPSQQVVNIQVDTESENFEDHMVVADGVVTGDLFVQRKLVRNRSNEERGKGE